MRILREAQDLLLIAEPLRAIAGDCLERWATSGTPYVPGQTDLVILVEQEDRLSDIAALVDLLIDLEDEEEVPPFEHVTDHGLAYEAVMLFDDDGIGCSLLIPKSAGIDARLLDWCEMLVTPAPAD
ncbi:MAG: hypothetical protein PHV02_11010 [Rhodocyclaceae bacterium]|nr:hypothetical protein [Rhodocyclaceae bacterium]